MSTAVSRFTQAHVEGAARLLRERHALHRVVEPLLADVGDFERQVADEFVDATGAVATRGGKVVGYLLGKPRESRVGTHLLSGLAGHATSDPALLGELYAFAAANWVADGLTRHYVFAPPLPEVAEAWSRLCFGASAVLGIRATSDPAETTERDDIRVRTSSPEDIGEVVRLAALLDAQLNASPSFSFLSARSADEELEEWRDVWTDDRFTHFVAERDGRVCGHVLLYRRPPDLRVPAHNIDLASASTDPEVRGSGVGRALTSHALAWAVEHGYATMTADWRITNLSAARFWPRRGFREAFLRFYRSIP